jgi:hypothetical protein
VFRHVTIANGPGGYGYYFLGSDDPMVFTGAAIREVLARPGILADISSAYDSPEHTIDGWVRRIGSLLWISDDQVTAYTGDGPLITDDRPLPEYFLLRHLFRIPLSR